MKLIEINLIIKGNVILSYRSEAIPSKDDMIFVNDGDIFIVEYRIFGSVRTDKVLLFGNIKQIRK